MTLTPEALARLRERLPYGYSSRVIRKLKGAVSQATVSKVAHGHLKNPAVLRTLVEVAEEWEQEQAQLQREQADLERRAKKTRA